MAIKALDLSKTWDFQSKDDPDFGTDDASTFKLQCLDSRIMGKLKDGATKFLADPNRPDEMGETSVNMNDMNFQMVQFGCTGWNNVLDPQGREPLEFKTIGRRLASQSYKVVDPEVLCLIPGDVIAEMAEDIRAKNELSEGEAKN